MKKKKLLRKIIELQELNDCLFSTITSLRIQLWGKCTPEQAKGTMFEHRKEPESKEQNDKRREIYEAQKPIDFPKVKTEPITRDEPAFTPQVFTFYNKEGVLTTSETVPDYVCTSEHYRFGDNAIMTFKERDRYHVEKYGCKQCEVSGTPVLETVISVGKTGGPESESELKENTISLEVGKKYEAENGYKLICKGFDETSIPSQRYQLTFEDGCGQMHYSKEGKVCVRSISKWDIVSEVKE